MSRWFWLWPLWWYRFFTLRTGSSSAPTGTSKPTSRPSATPMRPGVKARVIYPRVYATDVPRRWQKVSQEVTVTQKKRLLFRALLPLVLRANELISEERTRA